MRSVAFAALIHATLAASATAQGPGPWRMHDSLDWGMWLGPFATLAVLALAVASIVALVRWIGRDDRGRAAREILDERYARDDINREEYLRRRDDMSGRQ
jgi:uncharacterized membrane protein